MLWCWALRCLLLLFSALFCQARHEDSVTGGRNKFWGHEKKFIYVISKGARREVYSSVDQTKKEKTKKRSLPQKFYVVRCESSKITKRQFLLANSTAVNTNLGVLGLNLHSNSPKSVSFFGAQPSLGEHKFCWGGAQAVIWGSTAPECPPVALGLFFVRNLSVCNSLGFIPCQLVFSCLTDQWLSGKSVCY